MDYDNIFEKNLKSFCNEQYYNEAATLSHDEIKLSFVDGHPTISQSENSEAGIVRNISTLNDTSNISKHDEKSSKNTRIKKQYHDSDFEIER